MKIYRKPAQDIVCISPEAQLLGSSVQDVGDSSGGSGIGFGGGGGDTGGGSEARSREFAWDASSDGFWED
ncbi:MAG: hypothetical protein IJ692_02905 [Alloprevotella sp.]|nr:hypothetical protein [Alloprevotella sp.]MBR1652323.1 hypothetical protein [Alloprevotella sp.]